MNNTTNYGTDNSYLAEEQEKDPSVFQTQDVNSKRVFEDPFLCAQFLRDYSGLDELKDVQPEDIENVNLRYHLFDEAELNSDSVVRVKFPARDAETPPLYVVPLIDHKSSVDYNVSIQLFYYIACIWKDWEKEMKNRYGLDCRAKAFRYPFILPIVYYEGKDNWTADCRLSHRVCMSDKWPQYVPDFQYHVVRIHDYTDQELLEKKNEMSLLMVLNKIQKPGDLQSLQHLVVQEVDAIMKESPDSVMDIIVGTVTSLCRKLNVPEKETDDYISKIRKERRMGYLFENMEKMDIQLERRLRKEAEEKAEEKVKEAEEKAEEKVKEAEEKAEKKVKEAEEKAEKKVKEAEEKAKIAMEDARNAMESLGETRMQFYIKAFQDISYDFETVSDLLRKNFNLDNEKAASLMQRYWGRK